jgi:DNA-binding NarL/FixJ family response regulator
VQLVSGLAGKRVLVVDDDSLLALDLEIFLQDQGCVVVGPAPTADAALALIAAELPDLAILDIDLNGDTSALIADALAVRGVDFLFISGHSRSMLPAAHSKRQLLAKPWSEAGLRDALGKLLG